MFGRNNNIEKEEKPMPKWVRVLLFTIIAIALLALFCIAESHWIFSFNPSTVNEYMSEGETGHFIKDTTTMCNGPYFQMKHTINGIPVCTEYYYLCGDNETNTIYVVRADKNYYRNNFNAITGVNESGVKLSGLIRTPSYELKNAMARTAGDILDGEYEINMMTKYIDLMSMRVALGTLIGYILLAVAIILFKVFGEENKPTDNKLAAPAALISLMAGLVVLLHYINYIM